MAREVDVVLTCCEFTPRAVSQVQAQSGWDLLQAHTPRGCLVSVYCTTKRRPLDYELDALVAAFKAAAFSDPHLATLTIKSDDGSYDLRIGGDA